MQYGILNILQNLSLSSQVSPVSVPEAPAITLQCCTKLACGTRTLAGLTRSALMYRHLRSTQPNYILFGCSLHQLVHFRIPNLETYTKVE